MAMASPGIKQDRAPGSGVGLRRSETLAALADEASAVAILLGALAGALDDFSRVPVEEREALVRIARGDAINVALNLASGLALVRRSREAGEVRWMAQRLHWPQASLVRRDAEQLREMAEALGREG